MNDSPSVAVMGSRVTESAPLPKTNVLPPPPPPPMVPPPPQPAKPSNVTPVRPAPLNRKKSLRLILLSPLVRAKVIPFPIATLFSYGPTVRTDDPAPHVNYHPFETGATATA